MSELLKRLNSYDFFTSLLPGCLYTWYLARLHGIVLMESDMKVAAVVYTVFVWYFLGLVINRIGAGMKRVFESIGLIEWVAYERYVRASKQDSLIRVLSEKNNTYRSMAALCLVVIITEIVLWVSGRILLSGVCILAALIGWGIFVYSQSTQSAYIVERVEIYESEMMKSGTGDSQND